jgi:hypothetical protein
MAGFTRQLGAMLDAGVNVLRALRIASQHSGNQQLIEAARDICRRLEDGREFHQAIASHTELFDPFYVEMARQGEGDGLLGKALLSVADYLDRVAQGAPGPPPTHPQAVTHPLPMVTTMLILGVQAIGAAAIWSVATAQPELLPMIWLGPLAALWVGVCLLSGAWILHRLRRPASLQASAKPAPLPPKSVDRKAAETEGVVRNALLEQREEMEARPPSLSRPSVAPPDLKSKAPEANGKRYDPSLFEPDEDPPRFEL